MRIAIYAKTSRPAVLGNIAKGVEALGLAPRLAESVGFHQGSDRTL